MFTLYSSHELVAYESEGENDDLEYADPLGFGEGGSGATSCGEGCIVVDAPYDVLNPYATSEEYILVGSTSYEQYGAAPQINGVSAVINGSSYGGVSLNTSGTLKIVGLYLTAGGADPYPTPAVASGPNGQTGGLSLGGVTVISDSEVDVQFSAGSQPSYTGTYFITIQDAAGTSNPGQITVGDPTPVISSIAPSSWMAGTTYACGIQISGSGFGTNPALNIVSADGGNEVASYSICGSPADGSITATVVTNTNYTAGAVNVSVTSQGYTGYGSGFLSAQGNSSGSQQQYVVVGPAVLPNPQILFNGQNVAGQTVTPVYIGQQIALTAVIPNLGANATISSETWSARREMLSLDTRPQAPPGP